MHIAVNALQKHFSANAVIVVLALVFAAAIYLTGASAVVLACLVGVAAALLIAYPHWGVYLLILSLPFTEWHITRGEFEIPPVDIVGLVLVLIFLLRLALLYVWQRERFAQESRLPLLAPFAAVIAASFVSALFAEDVFASFWYTVRWLVLLYVAYIFVPYNALRTSRQLRGALVSFVAVGLFAIGVGAYSLTQQDFANEFVRVRPVELFGQNVIGTNHNLLAELFVVPAFFALALANGARRRSWQYAWLAVSTLTIIFLIGTFSRAAWIVLVVGAGFYFISAYGRHWRRFVPWIVLVVLAVTPLAWYMVALQTSAVGVGATYSRLELTIIARDAFMQRPWTGWGSGTYLELVERTIWFPAKYGDPLESHGIIQKVVAETGLVGSLALGYLVGAILYCFYRAVRELQSYRFTLAPLVAGAMGMGVFEIFNTSYYQGKLWVPVSIALAAIALAQRKERNAQSV